MPITTGGDYTLPSNSVSPAVAGTKIDPADFNATLDDIETAVDTLAGNWHINASSFLQFSSPVYYDDSGGYIDRSGIITLARTLTTPGSVKPAISVINVVTGDNATFQGGSGAYFQSRDGASITSGQRGVLYGAQFSVVPRFNRTNYPYDDAVPIIVSNDGSARGTEAVYCGHNVSGGGRDFACGFSMEGYTSDAAFNATGLHGYGLDLCRSGNSGTTFDYGGIRLPNNTTFVSKNAANSANITIATVDASDLLQLRNGVVTVGSNYLAVFAGNMIVGNGYGLMTATSAGNTMGIGAWDVDGGSRTDFITLTANNTPTCVIASAVTATTQSASDNSTKLATTAYVDGIFGATGRTVAGGANAAAIRSTLGVVIGTDVQAYDADLTTLGAGGASARSFLGATAATAWTPTFTADAGSFTTVTIVAARYTRWNGIVTGALAFQVTTAGTASGAIKFTLPSTPAYSSAATGGDVSATKALIAAITAGSNVCRCCKYDGTDPIVGGNYYTVAFHYEE